jgi:hypothetical protein
VIDEGTERPGLFAKGSVGRFVLALTVGAVVFVVAVCGLGSVVTGAVLVEGGKHYLSTHDDEIEAASEEGRAFAEGRTITECVREAQQRSARCTSLLSTCAMPIGLFAGACTRAAIDDGYCATVPLQSETVPSSEWKKTSCTAAPSVWCELVMSTVQSACEDRKEEAAKTVEDDALE